VRLDARGCVLITATRKRRSELHGNPIGTPRALPRISLTPEEAAASTGFSVRRIFQAIKDEKLTARKAGKATVIEFAELSRWVGTLPTRGRPQEPIAALAAVETIGQNVQEMSGASGELNAG